MIIESDFYRTEAGRRHFTMQLDSIRYCVQEVHSLPLPFTGASLTLPLRGRPATLT